MKPNIEAITSNNRRSCQQARIIARCNSTKNNSARLSMACPLFAPKAGPASLNLKDYFSHHSVTVAIGDSFAIARLILKPYQGAENGLVLRRSAPTASSPSPNDRGPECADFSF